MKSGTGKDPLRELANIYKLLGLTLLSGCRPCQSIMRHVDDGTVESRLPNMGRKKAPDPGYENKLSPMADPDSKVLSDDNENHRGCTGRRTLLFPPSALSQCKTYAAYLIRGK